MEDVKFHSDRVIAELEMAVRSRLPTVARAHFDLSAQHLRRAFELGQAQPVAAQG